MTSIPSLQSIQALILDMDGVLWRGSEAIGNLHSIFERISHLGLKVVFATNNGSRTINQYIDVLASFGVNASPWQIVTSATVASDYLRRKFPDGGRVFIIGEQGIIDACQLNGFYQADSEVLAVVVGIDRKLTYDKLKSATHLLRSGALFIGTNPDKTFPTPNGLVPGAGSILAALSAASDLVPVIAGKPEPRMYQVSLDRLSLPPEKVLVVGDRPETDIAGAQQIGCPTALVLSGVTNRDQALAWKPKPDIIAEDLDSLIRSLQ